MRVLGTGVGRLRRSFAAITALIAIAAGAGGWGMQQQSDLHRRIESLETVKNSIQELRYDAADVSGWQGLVLADAAAFGYDSGYSEDSYNRQEYEKATTATLAHIHEARTGSMVASERLLWSRLEPAWNDYFHWDDVLKSWMKADNHAALARSMTELNEGDAGMVWSEVLEIADELNASVSTRIDDLNREADTVRNTSMIVLGVALLAALLLATVLSARVTRSVVRPLSTVVGALRRLAEGDLTVRAGGTRTDDELGHLGAALDNTAMSLQKMVGSVSRHAGAMSAASTRLSDNAAEIAAAAEQASGRAGLVAAAPPRCPATSTPSPPAARDGRVDPRDRARTRTARRRRGGRGRRRPSHQRHRRALGVVLAGDRQRGQGDHRDRRADQPARAQRHHRGGPGRRGRQGLRGRRQRGQGPGPGDRPGHRGHRRGGSRRSRPTPSGAVAAIGQIAEVIDQISDYQTTIASAVEEQTATTDEMSRNVERGRRRQRARSPTNIAGVAESATVTARGAARSQQEAYDIARLSEELYATVAAFKI